MPATPASRAGDAPAQRQGVTLEHLDSVVREYAARVQRLEAELRALRAEVESIHAARQS